MLHYPEINPIAFSLGPLKVHWYGIMYLVGFVAAWLLAQHRAKRPNSGWQTQQVADLIFYAAIGVVVGGRLGYALFYDFQNVVNHPLTVFAIWNGGMSFHGGLIGVIVATLIFAKAQKRHWTDVIDFVAPLVPIGLAAGRVGNFINDELWGRVTNVPWGMVYPNGGANPRHPSQIYEFLLEGVLLFVIIWTFSAKPRPRFAVSALFLCCYGTFRVIAECFRQPDLQFGYLAFGWLTMGQLLSFPMILIGLAALIVIYRKRAKACG